MTNRLTLDYGVRFVHQQPQYDTTRPGVELPAGQVDRSARRRCCTSPAAPTASIPCTRHQPAGDEPGDRPVPRAEHDAGDRHASCPNTGNPTNGLFLAGQGIAETYLHWPALGVAPRFGMAYDLTGEQRFVLRGGGGLFFDRPSGNSVFAQVLNPPTLQNVTVRYGSCRRSAAAASTTEAPPALSVYEYDSALPSSTQWNAGVQMTLPWATALDVVVRRPARLQHRRRTINLNAVDFGAAFLPQNQDPTLAAEHDARRDGGRRPI